MQTLPFAAESYARGGCARHGRDDAGVRRLQLAVALVAVGYLVTTLPFVRGDAHYIPAFDITLPLTALAPVGGAGRLARGRVPAERAICLCLAGAILSWGLGDAAWFTLIGPSGAAPVPSWSDLGFLGFYPPAYAAIGLMLRARGARIPTSMWLDGRDRGRDGRGAWPPRRCSSRSWTRPTGRRRRSPRRSPIRSPTS